MTRWIALLALTACGRVVEPPDPPALEGCTYTVRIPLDGGGVLTMVAHYRADHPFCLTQPTL